ncbi:hypothetical protein BDW42DRAFT_158883 [Aspergillus taichungensis]|uniref:F-box domain-containing protein n=1 Tax=Aspergillus taichungensis TaxID=482145 RepID=A0A2J5I8K6_9EURO|nr:hypothetical protein BDW42DRAFT_158883 [Aspergillus taichungensis]
MWRLIMEKDVSLPGAERLNGHEQLVHVLPLQLPSQPPRRMSLEKTRGRTGGQIAALFNRLPRTVIELILYVAEPSTFASLALLNRKWRRISDSYILYDHQLSRCPSFALTQRAFSNSEHPGDLATLKHRFAIEIRRNGFAVYFRPRKTLIKLISTSLSSSTAFPQGEAFRFAFSPNAQLILCISSSRIVVLDVTPDRAVVRHELKTWRRPLNATILDDGSILAVVSSTHQVNIYDLSTGDAKHVQNIELNDAPRTLTLSPTGGVLAVAYDDRIEVYAIGQETLVTERRAVRCQGVDSISFSSDGFMLLGSSVESKTHGLVTITVPFYTDADVEASPRDAQIRMWTSQVLFPDITTGFSHASLLPQHAEGESSWLLGFDREVGAFRAIGASDVNSGTAYFGSPLSSGGAQECQPSLLPTADSQGELIALGFEDSGLWVFGVPARLDIAPSATSAGAIHAAQRNGHNRAPEEPSLTGPNNLPRLRESITRPKLLIDGHQMSDMPGITAASWVRRTTKSPDHRRLVAVAPGGIRPPTLGEEDVPVDGGRVLLLDFDRCPQNGPTVELNIEVGDTEPKMLGEPNPSLDTEVELERRRTHLRRGGPPQRANAPARESYPASLSSPQLSPDLVSRDLSLFSTMPIGAGEGDMPSFPDSPYNNTQPRSGDTLRRAASAAAASRGRYNPQQRQEARRVHDNTPVHPLFQVPHESDADNWVPPPPPYSREPDGPLPDYLRRTLQPSRTEPLRRVSQAPGLFRRSHTTRLEDVSERSSRSSLHRLNTISISSLASPRRRNTVDSDTDVANRRPPSSMRRRASSTTQHVQIHEEPAVPPLPEHIPTVPLATSQTSPAPPAPAPAPQPDSPSGLWSNAAPTWIAAARRASQRLNSIRHPPEDGVRRGSAPGRQPPANDLTSYPYFRSSPNLQTHNPQYIQPPRWYPQYRSGYHRPADRRSQSHDITQLSPMGPTIPPLSRRVSTEPTFSSSSQASHDLWRRRIEDWNEQTINERSRKRSKCIVM